MRRDRYIVIEGHDGTGKSTQVELLRQYFAEQGRETVIIEEPGSDDPEKSTPVAQYLRALIKNGTMRRDPEFNLALFSAARRELWQQKIQPALGRGAVVLSSRNYLSTLAYQGYGEGLDREHILEVTRLFTDPRYISPDDTIVLKMNDETERITRINKRGQLEHPDTFESKNDDFQQRVNNGYANLANAMNLPIISCIDDRGRHKSAEEIHQEIINMLGETSVNSTDIEHS